MSMEIFGFDEFKDDLLKLKQEYPKEVGNFVKQTAYSIERKVKFKTPVGVYPDRVGGNLQRNWTVTNFKSIASEISVEVINPTHYAKPVEYGHRIMRNGKQVGYVYGRYMLTKSLAEAERELPKRFTKLVERLRK